MSAWELLACVGIVAALAWLLVAAVLNEVRRG
jgi:hypothetical protein